MKIKEKRKNEVKKTLSLKKTKEFQRVLNKGKWFGGTLISVYILPNRSLQNKIGLAVGKKVGKATKRNRTKRVIRAVYQSFENNLKVGYNILFVWKSKAHFEDLKYEIIQRDMKRAFDKADLFEEVERYE